MKRLKTCQGTHLMYFPGPDGEHHPNSRNINSDDQALLSAGRVSELPTWCGSLALESVPFAYVNRCRNSK